MKTLTAADRHRVAKEIDIGNGVNGRSWQLSAGFAQKITKGGELRRPHVPGRTVQAHVFPPSQHPQARALARPCKPQAVLLPREIRTDRLQCSLPTAQPARGLLRVVRHPRVAARRRAIKAYLLSHSCASRVNIGEPPAPNPDPAVTSVHQAPLNAPPSTLAVCPVAALLITRPCFKPESTRLGMDRKGATTAASPPRAVFWPIREISRRTVD
jgi:hypothetical protein